MRLDWAYFMRQSMEVNQARTATSSSSPVLMQQNPCQQRQVPRSPAAIKALWVPQMGMAGQGSLAPDRHRRAAS